MIVSPETMQEETILRTGLMTVEECLASIIKSSPPGTTAEIEVTIKKGEW